MIEKDAHLHKNTVLSASAITIEQARSYNERRFGRVRRMKRLGKLEKEFARRLFGMAGKHSCIVDIPCGSGRFFDIFSHAKKLIMLDYSESMLKAAEEKIGGAENVRLIQAEISAIPLSDNSADLCFCMRLFHHMETDEVRLRALKELARVSKKYVALSFYNKNSWKFYRRKILGKKVRGFHITFEYLNSLANRAGLKCVARFPRLNLVHQQCLVALEKTRDAQG